MPARHHAHGDALQQPSEFGAPTTFFCCPAVVCAPRMLFWWVSVKAWWASRRPVDSRPPALSLSDDPYDDGLDHEERPLLDRRGNPALMRERKVYRSVVGEGMER